MPLKALRPDGPDPAPKLLHYCRLRFFNVDGVNNPKVQSVYLADMPVHKAAFAGGGTQARGRPAGPASPAQPETLQGPLYSLLAL